MRSAAGAAAVALLLVILLWASNSILVKIVLREIDPLTLTWLRYVIAGLFYVPYAVLTRAEAPRYTWREGVMLVAAGVALVPVFNLTLYWALGYTTVANTALVRMTEPAWVLLLGALLLGERAMPRQLGGFALALLGTLALVLLGRQPSGGGEHHVLGMLYMGANSLAWVGYILCFKDLLRRHRVAQLTTHAALVGTAALFLATGWTHARTIADQAFAMSALGWVLVVAMALLVTIASNQLFAFGLQRVPAGVATAYSYLIPVFAAGGAWLFLGEPITKVVVVCGAVIAAGIYLINRPESAPCHGRSDPYRRK